MEQSLNQIISELGGGLRFTILSYLWLHRKIYPSELAEELNVSRTQISRELRYLEDNELIIKSREENKFVAIKLSPKCIDLWIEFLDKLGSR